LLIQNFTRPPGGTPSDKKNFPAGQSTLWIASTDFLPDGGLGRSKKECPKNWETETAPIGCLNRGPALFELRIDGNFSRIIK